MIDDDATITKQMAKLLKDEKIGGFDVNFEYNNDFDKGLQELEKKDYDIVVLDIFKGKPDEKNTDRPGETILGEIRKKCFTTIIFFTGLPKVVQGLESDIIRVVRKSDGVDELNNQIEYVLDTGLPLLKRNLNDYIKESMRSYFWEFVQQNWSEFKKIKENDDISLGYLLIRRLAVSLAKEKIFDFIGLKDKSPRKVHPMEFYIYPPDLDDYETGDILKKDDKYFVIITPSCDLIKRNDKMSAEKIFIVQCIPLESTKYYKKYNQNKNSTNKDRLKRLIESRGNDRYFFLPGTYFIDNLVIDFQFLDTIAEGELETYEKVAKLDDPFTQSMVSYFIRYYNRIGTPDIDSDLIISKIE